MTGDPLGLPGYEGAVPVSVGGSSAVWRARETAFDRTVAVKVLAFPVLDEDARRRYGRELALAGRLSGHPHVLTVHTSGFTADGRPYLTSEWCPAGSLADVVARTGPLAPEQVAHVGAAVAEALQAAHAAGVVHRDVKPQNVLLTAYGRPALADFGIAYAVAEVTSPTDGLTPSHAAPEVLQGGSAGPAADLWGLGSTLWTLLTGTPPYAAAPGEGVLPVLLRVLGDPLPALPEHLAGHPLAEVLQDLLAKDPAARPSATEAAEVLAPLSVGAAPLPADGPTGVTGSTLPGAAEVTHGPRPAEDGPRPAADAGPPAAGVVHPVLPPGPAPDASPTVRRAVPVVPVARAEDPRRRSPLLLAGAVAAAVVLVAAGGWALTRPGPDRDAVTVAAPSPGASPVPGAATGGAPTAGAADEPLPPSDVAPVADPPLSQDLPPLAQGEPPAYDPAPEGGPPAPAPREPQPSAAPGARAPGAPTALRVAPGDAVLTVTWAPPSSDGGAPLRGYEVLLDGRAATTTGPTARSATVKARNDQRHTVTVDAVNAAGRGPAATGSATPRARQPARVPVYRCDRGGEDLLYTTSSSCGPAYTQKGRPFSVTRERGVPGTTPLYRVRNRSTGRHLLTFRSAERTGCWRTAGPPTGRSARCARARRTAGRGSTGCTTASAGRSPPRARCRCGRTAGSASRTRSGRDRPGLASSLVPADRSADLAALDATLTSIEKVLDLPRLRVELSDLEAQAGEPGPVGRHGQGAGDHHPAVDRAERPPARRGAARPARRPRRAVRDGRRGGRREHCGGGRGRARDPAPRDQQPRGPHPAVRRVRPARGPGADHPRCRRCRQPGLGADALAHVLPLGRAARLPARRARVAGGRGGRREERRLPVQGPVRLRHPRGRARRAPPGPHLAVRQPGPPADVVRDGRRDAGRRHGRRRRGRREGDPRRRVPLERSRRSGRQHDRLGGAHHAPADEHRGVLPERALADPEPRRRDDRAADQAARAQARGGAGRDGRDPRHQGRHRLRVADPQLRAAPVPDGQGPAHRSGERQHRRRSWTARSTSSSRRRSAGAGRAWRASPRAEGTARPRLRRSRRPEGGPR